MARLCREPGFTRGAMATPGVVVTLSIAKSLMAKMRGRIGLHSERRRGNIFLSRIATFPEPANLAKVVGPVV